MEKEREQRAEARLCGPTVFAAARYSSSSTYFSSLLFLFAALFL